MQGRYTQCWTAPRVGGLSENRNPTPVVAGRVPICRHLHIDVLFDEESSLHIL